MRLARPISSVFRPARRFLRREGGNAVIESVLLLPLLLWAAFGLYVFWDGYKVSNKLQKATYTVADIASRWQAVPLAATDVVGMQNLMEYMISEGDEPRLRMTSVIWVEARNRFEVRWSCSMNPLVLPPFTTATLQLVADRIPETADGGTQVIVESEYDFAPLFDNGIEAMTFREFVPVRPRFEAVNFTDPQNCN
jgi:hypothetical protein